MEFGKAKKIPFNRLPMYRKTFGRLNPYSSNINGATNLEKGGRNVHLLQNMYCKSFKKLVKRRTIVHDTNLKLRASETKDQVDLSEFKASK